MLKRDAEKFCKNAGCKKIDFSKIGKYIGQGAHGHVYHYGNDKIIKLSSNNCEFDLNELQKAIKSTSRFKAFANAYDFGVVKDEIYWIIMEFLPKKIEKKHYELVDMIDYIIAFEDCSDVKCLPKKWQTMTRSLMNYHKRNSFFYGDIHENNIMFDKHNNPKFTDLESLLW